MASFVASFSEQTKSEEKAVAKRKEPPPKPTEPAAKTPAEAKSDLATFSKLTPKQQVLKRYEMMNKKLPSVPALADAAAKAKKPAATAAAGQVPRLLLDESGY